MTTLFIILLEVLVVGFVAFGLDHHFGGTGRVALIQDIKALPTKKVRTQVLTYLVEKDLINKTKKFIQDIEQLKRKK